MFKVGLFFKITFPVAKYAQNVLEEVDLWIPVQFFTPNEQKTTIFTICWEENLICTVSL